MYLPCRAAVYIAVYPLIASYSYLSTVPQGRRNKFWNVGAKFAHALHHTRDLPRHATKSSATNESILWTLHTFTKIFLIKCIDIASYLLLL